LEIKLRKKLAIDPYAVIYSGMVSDEPQKVKSNRGKKHKQQNIKSNVKLESLNKDHERSFKREREQIMDNLKFPSPVRSLLEREIMQKKHKQDEEHKSLPPVAGAYKKRPIPSSNFPGAYNRGIQLMHDIFENIFVSEYYVKDKSLSASRIIV
jgi:hypothetical protein